MIGKVPKQRAAGPYRANEKARSHTRPLACSHLIVLCPAGHHSDEIPTGNSFQASIRPRRGIAWSENNLCPRLAHTSSSHPAPIPAWRSEALTLAEARREGLGGWLPLEETIPAGFDFDNAWVELGQGRDYLSAYWYKGYDYIDVTVYRRTEGGILPRGRPAGGSGHGGGPGGPGELCGQRRGDTPGWRWLSLTADFTDDVRVNYSLKGVTPEQAAAFITGGGLIKEYNWDIIYVEPGTTLGTSSTSIP